MNQEKIFFTSDTHFGHENILKFCPETRRFASVEEMDEMMIEHWNDQVDDQSTVFHLGDFAFRGVDRCAEILQSLQGRIMFVVGNHDSNLDRARKKLDRIQQDRKVILPPLTEYKLGVDRQRVVMCHYALRVWNHHARGTWHLFGHSHGSLPGVGKSVDVGVDSTEMIPYRRFEGDTAPLPFSAVADYMETRAIHSCDHHG